MTKPAPKRSPAPRPKTQSPVASARALVDAAIREASDAATPAARLTELWREKSPRVLRALASNPSTPRDVLHQLLERFPDEVDANPVSLLMAMTEPTLDERVRRAQAARSRDDDVLTRLAQQHDLDWLVASNPATSPALLVWLAVHGNTGVREAVARHPSCPLIVLEILAGDAAPSVQCAASGNPRCPVAVLDTLTRDACARVRLQTPGDRQTPGEETTSSLRDAHVLLATVASKPDCSGESLALIASLDEPSHDLRVARHTGAPAAVLERLATSANQGVRVHAAGNPSTPPESLARLALDPDPWVRLAVVDNPSLPSSSLDRLAYEGTTSIQKLVAGHPSAPVSTLHWLAAQDDLLTRQGVATHPSCPPETLAALASDASPAVRKLVAQNPATPGETLRQLLADHDRIVRRFAIVHPAAPVDVLARLASKGRDAMRATLALRERDRVADRQG